MKRTGAWLAVYALEQIGARFTFGIPGVHTTELYDALNSSDRITQTRSAGCPTPSVF
jgi:acetolactate synthase-1/2/3 large subunit